MNDQATPSDLLDLFELEQTLLVYAVSEPGEWTPLTMALDLCAHDTSATALREAADRLCTCGLLLQCERPRLTPTPEGRALVLARLGRAS